jgi:photosystem II stability/assembly factor-like uncharacterized protein
MTPSPAFKVIVVVVIAAFAIALGSFVVGDFAFFGAGKGSMWVSENEGITWSEVAPAKGISSLASLFAFTTSTPLQMEPFLLIGSSRQGLILAHSFVHQNQFAAVSAPFVSGERVRIYDIDQSRQHPHDFFLAVFEDGLGKIVKWTKPIIQRDPALPAGGSEVLPELPGTTQTLYTAALRDYGMFAVRVDPANDRHLWAGGGDGLLVESNNGGMTWTTSARFREGIRHIIGHPVLASRMWILGSRGTFLTTTNGGATWTKLNKGLSAAKAGDIHQLFYDVANDQLIAGTDRGVIRSRDNGLSWELLPVTIPPSALPVRGVAFHPRDAQTLVISAANLVYKSKDGGFSWDRNLIPENTIIQNLFFSPKPPYPLYATVD